MPDPPRKEPETIREMFGSIANRYDLLNRVLSLTIDQSWRRHLARQARGEWMLDVACGTGDVMRSLEDAHPSARVFGLDFSEPMLRGAVEKGGGHWNVTQGDALRLPFRDASFDTVSCSFGVRNFVDRHQAFDEWRRVLRPGGRALILEFFPPDDRWYLKPYRIYLRYVLPRIGKWVSGVEEAYGYLRDSVESFADRGQVVEELMQSGFKSPETQDLSGGIATLIVADTPQ